MADVVNFSIERAIRTGDASRWRAEDFLDYANRLVRERRQCAVVVLVDEGGGVKFLHAGFKQVGEITHVLGAICVRLMQ